LLRIVVGVDEGDVGTKAPRWFTAWDLFFNGSSLESEGRTEIAPVKNGTRIPIAPRTEGRR
jgi:hypothetical protein